MVACVLVEINRLVRIDRNEEEERMLIARCLCASSSWGPAAPTTVSGLSSPSTSHAPPPRTASYLTSLRWHFLPPVRDKRHRLPLFWPHRSGGAALRGLGGGHAGKVSLRSPRLSARRQGRPPRPPPLPNNHQVATHKFNFIHWIELDCFRATIITRTWWLLY